MAIEETQETLFQKAEYDYSPSDKFVFESWFAKKGLEKPVLLVLPQLGQFGSDVQI